MLAHVNLMVDTFIANANLDDLRYTVRALLVSGTPSLTTQFTAAARTRLLQTNGISALSSNPLFTRQPCDEEFAPTQDLKDALRQARALYGAGMGFTSLGILTSIVQATVGIRWGEQGNMAEVLAEIDADIEQAIQSCKEEIDSGRISNIMSVLDVVKDLQTAMDNSCQDVQSWSGTFPFERALLGIEDLRRGSARLACDG